MVPFERALVSFYRSSIVTFPLSLRVSEILPLLFYRTPLLPYPPLVSPKFPHVPVGLGGSPFGDTDRRCWADSPCNQFPRFPTYVITIHQRHTDRQTDGRHAIARPRFALCIVHRAVIKLQLQQNANEGCNSCASLARLLVVAAIILSFKFYRKFYCKFYCSCDHSINGRTHERTNKHDGSQYLLSPGAGNQQQAYSYVVGGVHSHPTTKLHHAKHPVQSKYKPSIYCKYLEGKRRINSARFYVHYATQLS